MPLLSPGHGGHDLDRQTHCPPDYLVQNVNRELNRLSRLATPVKMAFGNTGGLTDGRADVTNCFAFGFPSIEGLLHLILPAQPSPARLIQPSLLLGLSRAGYGISKPTDQRNRTRLGRYSATPPVSRLPFLEPHHFGARALDVLLSLRHMPDGVHGKQSSACILLIVKTCMLLHAKHLYRKSVTGAQTTRLECPSPGVVDHRTDILPWCIIWRRHMAQWRWLPCWRDLISIQSQRPKILVSHLEHAAIANVLYRQTPPRGSRGFLCWGAARV